MRAKSLGLPHWGWLLAALLASPLFFTLLFVHDWAGYLLGLVCVAAVVLVARIMLRADAGQRRGLWQIVVLMLLGTLVLGFRPAGRQLHQPVYRSLRRSALVRLDGADRAVPVG